MAQLPAIFSRYREEVDEELHVAMPRYPSGLDILLRYHMGWVDSCGDSVITPVSQGKSLRPTLCLLSCEALGGRWEAALGAAAALEYIHNFSLIHDDIQDGDVERRHRPTVWVVWGQPRALVAGDAMRAVAEAAAHRLRERGVDLEVAFQASALLSQGCLEMIQGQCRDISFEGNLHIGLDDYLAMVSLKTGALIRYSMIIGALLGSGQPDTMAAFARCGAFLGKAFQVRDDVLGIWGDEAITGKAVGSDIRRKKKSYPIVYALEMAGGTTCDTLMGTLAKEALDDSDVAEVLGVLEEVGAQEHACAFTRENATMALQELEGTQISAWARAEFQELVRCLTTRDY